MLRPMRQVLRPALVALLLLPASSASAVMPSQRPSPRRTTTGDFSLDVERVVLEDGLVVLLAPDETSSGVLVEMAFQAGTLHEPPGKSGLAHLVEHMLSRGPTPDTDYFGLIEAQGGFMNATTSADLMRFYTRVPSDEVSLALWTMADRLGTVSPRITPEFVAKNLSVVAQERVEHLSDEPHGLLHEELFSRLYGAVHPLRGNVLGLPKELATVTAADAQAFIDRCIVPPNAVLTVVGSFDRAAVRAQLEPLFGGLKGGERLKPPSVPPPPHEQLLVTTPEELAHEPRVVLAWRIPNVVESQADALSIGSLLLSIYLDGQFGAEVSASFAQVASEGLFRLTVTLPHDKPEESVRAEAEAYLRYLTLVEMPIEVLDAAYLAMDRALLFRLDSIEGRAALLSELELRYGAAIDRAKHLEHHWQMERAVVRDTARDSLRRGLKLTIQDVPRQPRQPRPEREE